MALILCRIMGKREHTEFISCAVFSRVDLLGILETPPQPLGVLVVGKRHGILLVLKVIQPRKDRSSRARRLRLGGGSGLRELFAGFCRRSGELGSLPGGIEASREGGDGAGGGDERLPREGGGPSEALAADHGC